MDDIIVPELQNVDTTLIIDPDTRTIDAGSDFLLGVETDNDAERVKFQCPKIVGDNLDLSQYHIYIHYQNAKGEKGKYLCEDIEDGGENITFSWLLSQKAVLYKGQTKFLVCAKKTQEETIVWNTTLANGNVLEGLDVDEEIVQQNDDVIEQILLKLEQIEASGGSYTLPIATPTQLGGVKPVAKTDEMTQEVGVDEAGKLFTKEGVGIDEETLNQINKNTEDISKLSDEKANKTYVDGEIAKAQLEGAGVDTSQFVTQDDLINVSDEIANYLYVGDTQPTNGALYWLDTSEDTSSDTPSDEPNTPTEATLTSISATYSGGDITVGTSVNSLSGITVKANYSDGTSKTVTDYTLSGSINEGANTIAVSYGGKTTTFTVNGVAQTSGDEYTNEVAVNNIGNGTISLYSDGGDTKTTSIAKSRSYTNVFETETEVQVKLLLEETQYSSIYIGAYDGNNTSAMYYARKFNYKDDYALANKEYTDVYTVPAGYGVMIGGWSNVNSISSVTVKTK